MRCIVRKPLRVSGISEEVVSCRSLSMEVSKSLKPLVRCEIKHNEVPAWLTGWPTVQNMEEFTNLLKRRSKERLETDNLWLSNSFYE